MGDQMITGNRLSDGLVVFLRMNGKSRSWVEQIAEASVARDEAAREAMMEASQTDARKVVVEPYAIDVFEGEQGYEPVTIRERIRAFGPTAGLPEGS